MSTFDLDGNISHNPDSKSTVWKDGRYFDCLKEGEAN